MDLTLNSKPLHQEDTSSEHSDHSSGIRTDFKKDPEESRRRNQEGGKVKKDITICFRTNSDIRNYLESVAYRQRLSMSYVIESIIYNQMLQSEQAEKPANPERRQYQRKQVMLPAFIGKNPSQAQEFESGSVLDISLGGIRFAMPAKAGSKPHTDEAPAEYSVIFTLPDQRQPITVRCRPQSVLDAEEEVQIGAAFVDADFHSYQHLQKYLI